MAEIKIKLTDTTSISDIANFFQGLRDTQTVRARQTKEGAVELYVRGSSKWHLLTDNLKFSFLVKRDYQAAQEKIDDIFKQNGAIKSIKSPQENLKNIFSKHKHDFYAVEIIKDFKSAEKVFTQQKISKNNIEDFMGNSLGNYLTENLSDIVEYLADGFDTAPYPTLEFIKFIQSNIPTKKQSDANSLSSAELDFEQIENFAIEWQKLTVQKNASSKATEGISAEKTESKQELNFVKKSIAENFINKITAEICRNIPFARVNLSSETINNSSADLIIFDPSSGYQNYSILEHKVVNSSQNITDNDNDSIPFFTVTSHSNVKTLSSKPGIEGFKIFYTGSDDPVPNERIFNDLYGKLGAMIENEIKLQQANKSFTIHLPILNPFEKEKLTPEEEAMNLNAFVEHTNTWLSRYPNLRIQVQMPQDAKMMEFEEAYQLARHKAHKNQPIN